MSNRPVVDARERCCNDDDFACTVTDWIEQDPARVQSFLDYMHLVNDLPWAVEGDE